ncbi:MAG TPA: DUF1259 domain-containing protein, partial [Gemmataceae bacterium]|nr:DUF1259 domain-containing protein [Gemmataceae bacterium]
MTWQQKIGAGAVAMLLVSLTIWSQAGEGSGKLHAGKIGKAGGTKATTAPDGVVRLEWGRKDVSVKVDGMAFPPAAGLGSWAAFTPSKHGAMVMGDTVVFQDEVT